MCGVTLAALLHIAGIFVIDSKSIQKLKMGGGLWFI